MTSYVSPHILSLCSPSSLKNYLFKSGPNQKIKLGHFSTNLLKVWFLDTRGHFKILFCRFIIRCNKNSVPGKWVSRDKMAQRRIPNKNKSGLKMILGGRGGELGSFFFIPLTALMTRTKARCQSCQRLYPEALSRSIPLNYYFSEKFLKIIYVLHPSHHLAQNWKVTSSNKAFPNYYDWTLILCYRTLSHNSYQYLKLFYYICLQPSNFKFLDTGILSSTSLYSLVPKIVPDTY